MASVTITSISVKPPDRWSQARRRRPYTARSLRLSIAVSRALTMPATARPIAIVIIGTASATRRCMIRRACSSWISAALSAIDESWAASSPSCRRWIVRAGNNPAAASGRARPPPPFAPTAAASTAAAAAEISERVLGDAERRDQRHAVLQQAAERAGEPSGQCLAEQAASDWQMQQQSVELQPVGGTREQLPGDQSCLLERRPIATVLAAPTSAPRAINTRVEAGSSAPACSKIGVNCGST